MEEIPMAGYPKRSESTAFRIINDEAVILDLKSGVYYSLNEVGSRIWDLCNGTNNLNDITKIICEEFEVEEDTASKDVLEILNDFLQERLLKINESPE